MQVLDPSVNRILGYETDIRRAGARKGCNILCIFAHPVKIDFLIAEPGGLSVPLKRDDIHSQNFGIKTATFFDIRDR